MEINATKNTVALFVHQSCYREVVKPQWALQTMFAVGGTVDKLNSFEGASRKTDNVRLCGKDRHDEADQTQFSSGLSQDSACALNEHSA